MTEFLTGYGAGGYDWLDVWRRMYDAEREQAERIPQATQSAVDCWAQRATRFAAASERMAQPDDLMRLLLPHLRPTDTVLDIGSGTGRYVPVLAEHVARVIAIEPSPAMRSYLEQRVAAAGLRNVEVVAGGWPLEYAVQADVAFAAHVVYSVREIGPFLQAMQAAAKRMCVLFVMLRHMNAAFSPFWERWYGEARHLLPSGVETLNVLYQLGYMATLELAPNKPFVYGDKAEAMEEMRQRLRLPPSPAHDEALAAAVDDLLVRQEDGSLAFPNHPRYAGVVRWEPAT